MILDGFLSKAMAELGDAEYDAPNFADVPVEWITNASGTVVREKSKRLTFTVARARLQSYNVTCAWWWLL